jgi:adenylate cyclase
MGDGIMVLFGAPTPDPDHALHAVQAGAAMIREVRRLRQTWAALDYPQLRIGVGVHTGRAVLGLVGSPRRLDYTAIGDTVNVASRLESRTKKLACDMLISEDTYRDLPSQQRRDLGCGDEVERTELDGRHGDFPVRKVTVKDADAEEPQQRSG